MSTAAPNPSPSAVLPKLDLFDLSSLGIGGSGDRSGSNGPKLLAVSTFITALALVVVGARIYTRRILLGFLGRDDWCMIVAMMISIATAVVTGLVVRDGAGQHIWFVDFSKFTHLLLLTWVLQLLYVAALSLVKLSFLLQLLRLSAATNHMRTSIIIVFGLSIWFSITAFLVTLLQCIPLQYNWQRLDPQASGKCLNYKTVLYSVCALNIVMDFMVWVTPMQLVYRLRLPLAQKISLALIFSLGGVVCIAALFRVVTIHRIFSDPVALLDGTFHNADSIMWCVVEVNVAIICASLATLRPLFRYAEGRLMGRKIASEPDARDFRAHGSTDELARPVTAALRPVSSVEAEMYVHMG